MTKANIEAVRKRVASALLRRDRPESQDVAALLKQGEPAAVLAAAQDMLDDASNAGSGRLHMDVSGVSVGTLLDAYNALMAARKPAGEEGG